VVRKLREKGTWEGDRMVALAATGLRLMVAEQESYAVSAAAAAAAAAAHAA